MDFETFLKDYIWVPIILGALLLLLLIILICYCCKRQRRSLEYIPLISNEASKEQTRMKQPDMNLRQRIEFEKSQKQKALHTNAWLNAQYHLRMHPQFSDLRQLSPLGGRLNKNWFQITQTRYGNQLLMTMVAKPSGMVAPFTVKWGNTIRDMLELLQHPYIYPLFDIEFMVDQDLVVVKHLQCSRGSLKDLIYQCNYLDPWRTKYKVKKKGLSFSKIRTYGKQILAALIFMEEKGFPPHGHVHAGNVAVDSNCCRLMGCESSLIGEGPRIYPLVQKKIRRSPKAIDIVCFGHLLYEMSVGVELDTAHPEPRHLSQCRNPDIVAILNFIFPEDKKYPTLKEVDEHSFFSGVRLSALEAFPFARINLSKDMRNLVKAINRREPIQTRKKEKMSRSSSVVTGLNPDIEEVNMTAVNHVQGSVSMSSEAFPSNQAPPRPASPPSGLAPPLPPGFAPPPPPPPGFGFPPPPPPASSAPTGSTKSRSALLGDIQKGMRLKRTETNDRSAPNV
ncbi:slowpoke-binding protein-like [Dreissena polymorpha]|uniref:WH2 domain-containing protein n=1 Tax=Dreissena polymorpha TaxID=45954 RepID=A0A9D4JQ91_DREPO|nr:slowpoke-binding protein-like [Dreissena polymorpha]XP_052213716.1 slowpoke-binding protein-like [Dreissena polymorpha]KAH3820535.1 hypothetical protein DPMN_122279 [Dreissena polymorpha]